MLSPKNKGLIGARLRQARMRSKATQEEAGVMAGVTRATVSNWEAGRNLPDLLQFRALLVLYGVSGHQVLFGENPFDLTQYEAAELALAARSFSPTLRAKAEMMVTLLARQE